MSLQTKLSDACIRAAEEIQQMPVEGDTGDVADVIYKHMRDFIHDEYGQVLPGPAQKPDLGTVR
jgi:hypothetical protein